MKQKLCILNIALSAVLQEWKYPIYTRIDVVYEVFLP